VVPAEARSSAAYLRQFRTALSIIDISQASVGSNARTVIAASKADIPFGYLPNRPI
jgi:hypothetical protein